MSDRWYSNPTQTCFACRALVNGQTLNHMDVIEGVKGWRLSAIVNILRSDYDWPIVTEYRGPERIGHYHLSKTCDPLTLKYPPSAQPLLDELEALGGRDPGKGDGGCGSGSLHG